jgi:hypothetical protein
MRIHAKIALIPLLVMGTVCAAACGEERHRKFIAGTKITLKASKAKYFLGENILLDYRISYDGEGALDVYTVTGLGSPDCTVVAIDEDGKKAPASTRVFHSTGQSGRLLRRGDYVRFTIPLGHYCRLEKPGKYRIRAAHNLRWTDWDVAIAKDDPRWAETTIEVSMPDEAQARAVVERMLRASEDVKRYQQAFCTWNTGDYADFACLRFPVYLPILEKMAADKHGDSRALLGIAHNPAPAATQTLLRLLKTADKDRRKWITSALCDRLPEPKGVNPPYRRSPIPHEFNRVYRRNPIPHEDADPKLVKPSWRGEFAAPMRQFARQWLTDDDPTMVRCAAYVLEVVGVQEDMPELVAAVSRLVRVVERTRLPHFGWEIPPVRQACMDATYAVEAMSARGVDPKADPRTPGEIIHFVSAVGQRKDLRPKGWEKRYQDWVRNETPYVREHVLFNTPRPLPGSLLVTYRDGTRKVMATTHEPTTMHAAVRMAVELRIPVDEILARLVDRLDFKERRLYIDLIWCLRNLVETGKHERALMGCMPIPDEKGIAAVKARWKHFLQVQGQGIRNGKRFKLDSPELHRLMNPHSD